MPQARTTREPTQVVVDVEDEEQEIVVLEVVVVVADPVRRPTHNPKPPFHSITPR